jgi:hypothetical protein
MMQSAHPFFVFHGGNMKKETKFQKDLIDDIKERFPGAMVMKNDAKYIQGIPDLSVVYKDRWATLECKKSKNEPHQPNQDYYVEKMNDMSFSAFIYPENKEEILDAMEQSFKSRRSSRSSKSK